MAVSSDQGGEPVPFGILNAFPFVAQRLLLEGNNCTKVSIDFVVYPGINLVRPTEEEKLKGFPSGMIDAFFWVSKASYFCACNDETIFFRIHLGLRVPSRLLQVLVSF
jgi:hypothetical protein